MDKLTQGLDIMGFDMPDDDLGFELLSDVYGELDPSSFDKGVYKTFLRESYVAANWTLVTCKNDLRSFLNAYQEYIMNYVF